MQMEGASQLIAADRALQWIQWERGKLQSEKGRDGEERALIGVYIDDKLPIYIYIYILSPRSTRLNPCSSCEVLVGFFVAFVREGTHTYSFSEELIKL